VSLCHKEKFTMLWNFVCSTQGEIQLFLLLSDIRELIRSFHQDRESLQDSSGVEDSPKAAEGMERKRKRTVEDVDEPASASKRRG
jgi:hypothetical protein